MKRNVAILIAITAAIATQSANAAEFYNFYSGVRQYGMGGAYTSVVNDETSLLTNPAGLGKLRDYITTIADPELQGSFNDPSVVNYSNLTTIFDADKLRTKLVTQPGKHWNSKLQLFPSIVGPNFGIGLLAKYSYDAEVNSQQTVYRLDMVNDFAAVMGVNERFFGGIIKVGATARYMDRTEIHKDLDPNATVTINGAASEGTGLAADAGVILTAPVAMLPSLSVVVRDIGQTSYELSDGLFNHTLTRPAPSKQRIDAGVGLFPILANQSRLTLTADYQDVTNTNGDAGIFRHLHVGTELNYRDFFFLRAGMNQKYWTAGFELASERFQLQAASYGEEIGTSASPREDRRWVGKISIRF